MIVAITGLNRSGKTFLVNSLAEILSNTGNDVGIIDISKSRDLYYFYHNNININTLGAVTLHPVDSINFSNIDVYTSEKLQVSDEYFKTLNEKVLELNKEYKALILDIDLEYINKINLENIDSLNIVIDQRFINGDKNKILELLPKSKSNIILNKFLDTRFDFEKILDQFNICDEDPMNEYIKEKVKLISYDQINEEIYKDNFFKNKGIKKYSNTLKTELEQLLSEIGFELKSARKRKFFGFM